MRQPNWYCLVMTAAEFNWLRAWINAGVSPESEGAALTKKLDELADMESKPQRVFP